MLILDSTTCWFIFLVISTIFVHISWKISSAAEKYLRISSGMFSCFKTLYLDWFMCSHSKLFHRYSYGWSCIFLPYSKPLLQNIMIRYGNDSNKANVSYIYIYICACTFYTYICIHIIYKYKRVKKKEREIE